MLRSFQPYSFKLLCQPTNRVALRFLSTEVLEAIQQNVPVTEAQMQNYVNLANRGNVSWTSALSIAGGAVGVTGALMTWTAYDVKGSVEKTVDDLKKTVDDLKQTSATKDGVHAEIAGVKAQLTVQGKDIEMLRNDVKEMKEILKRFEAKGK